MPPRLPRKRATGKRRRKRRKIRQETQDGGGRRPCCVTVISGRDELHGNAKKNKQSEYQLSSAAAGEQALEPGAEQPLKSDIHQDEKGQDHNNRRQHGRVGEPVPTAMASNQQIEAMAAKSAKP